MGGTLEASPEWMQIILGLVILINLKIVNGTHCLILIGINVMLLSTLYKLVVMMRNMLKTDYILFYFVSIPQNSINF